MAKHKFIEFVGGCALCGKVVAAYEVDAETVQLRAETIGNKIINPTKNVTREEFAALKEEWLDGLNYQDARIVQRALDYMSVKII